MKIIIEDLYNSENNYAYSNQVEEHLGKILEKTWGCIYTSGPKSYHPYYDFTLNKKNIELKLTSRSNPVIEIAHGDCRPSGLLLTRSDYYLMLSPGGSKGKFVGKVRLYNTNVLKKALVDCVIDKDDMTIFEGAPGSICFKIDPHKVDHLWLGDCPLIMEDDKVTGFDITDFKPFTNDKILASFR